MIEICFGKERRLLRHHEPSNNNVMPTCGGRRAFYILLAMLIATTIIVHMVSYQPALAIGYSLNFTTLKTKEKQQQQQQQLVHFIHTTDQASFHRRSLRAVESVFFHHPNAKVLIHVPDDGETTGLTSDMTETPFSPLIHAGYNVTIQRFKLKPLVEAAISQEGSTIDRSSAEKWMRTKILPNLMRWNWYVDISDLVRLLVVYTSGGLYMDTDIIVVNPLDDLPNSIGFVRPGGPGSGVLKFDKGNQYLAACINEYFSNFRSNTNAWGFVGPKLLKRIYLKKYPTCHVPDPPAKQLAINRSAISAPLVVADDPSCPFHILWGDVYYPNVDNCFVYTPNVSTTTFCNYYSPLFTLCWTLRVENLLTDWTFSTFPLKTAVLRPMQRRSISKRILLSPTPIINVPDGHWKR
jgi:hypothetical protein